MNHQGKAQSIHIQKEPALLMPTVAEKYVKASFVLFMVGPLFFEKKTPSYQWHYPAHTRVDILCVLTFIHHYVTVNGFPQPAPPKAGQDTPIVPTCLSEQENGLWRV